MVPNLQAVSKLDGNALRRLSTGLCLCVALFLWIIVVGLRRGADEHSLVVRSSGEQGALRMFLAETTVLPDGRARVREVMQYTLDSGLIRGGRRHIPFVVEDVVFHAQISLGLQYQIASPRTRRREGSTAVLWKGIRLPAPASFNITLTYVLPPGVPFVLQGSDPALLPRLGSRGNATYTAVQPKSMVPADARAFDLRIAFPFSFFTLPEQDAVSGAWTDPVRLSALRWTGENDAALRNATASPVLSTAIQAPADRPPLGGPAPDGRFVSGWAGNALLQRGTPVALGDGSLKQVEAHASILPRWLLMVCGVLAAMPALGLLLLLTMFRARMGLVQKSFAVRRERERAATMIQSRWRGVLTRRRFLRAMLTIRERAKLRKRQAHGGGGGGGSSARLRQQ